MNYIKEHYFFIVIAHILIMVSMTGKLKRQRELEMKEVCLAKDSVSSIGIMLTVKSGDAAALH